MPRLRNHKRKLHKKPARLLPKRLHGYQGPWVYGEHPEPGRVHIDLYVAGCRYAHPTTIWATGGTRRLDEWLDVAHPPYDLHDPEHRRGDSRMVHDQECSNQHDGFCPGVQWLTVHMRNRTQIQQTVEKAYTLCAKLVRTAKSRERVTIEQIVEELGCGVLRKEKVPRAKAGISCSRGRHRSTMVAIWMSKWLKEAGCTVTIHFENLYQGVTMQNGEVDWRGPCGCHKGCAFCVHHADDSPDCLQKWVVAMKRAQTEVDAELMELTKHVRQDPKKDDAEHAAKRRSFSAMHHSVIKGKYAFETHCSNCRAASPLHQYIMKSEGRLTWRSGGQNPSEKKQTRMQVQIMLRIS